MPQPIRHDGFLLAIPVYNEEQYVADVLRRVRPYASHILAIDDGSTDETPRKLRAESDVQVITHKSNLGYGRSLADAFAFAIANRYRWLITMDCDDQHEPENIPKFKAAARIGDADIISGTRYPVGRPVDASVPADRLAINRRITGVINRRLGLALTDAFCGFKAYRVASLKRLRISEPGYAMPMQFWVQSVASDLRIREIPVALIYRDPTRHFGGLLDDPTVRFQHYLSVFEAEMARHEWKDENIEVRCSYCP